MIAVPLIVAFTLYGDKCAREKNFRSGSEKKKKWVEEAKSSQLLLKT